jgi:hypothetical protein
MTWTKAVIFAVLIVTAIIVVTYYRKLRRTRGQRSSAERR